MNDNGFAKKKDLDGLGGRVNKVEAFNERQKEVNTNTRRDIGKNEENVNSLYTLIRNQDRNMNKFIGGTSAIVVTVNLIAMFTIAWIMKG